MQSSNPPVQLELPFDPPLTVPSAPQIFRFCKDCIHYDDKTYPKVAACVNPQFPSFPEPLIYSRVRCGGKWWEPAK